MPARFLQSKLRAPEPHVDMVRRERLIQRLCESPAHLWLLSAAAGYGKTTLLRHALAEHDHNVMWLTVDRADNDPVRFWTHLAATVLGPGPELDVLVEQMDTHRLDTTADEIVAAIEHRTGRAALVLDDLHELDNQDTLDILGRLVTTPPSNLTIAIASRTDPGLPIGRLRASGQIVEMRAQDLAFTADEAFALFGTADPSGVGALVEHTEGWPTALRMLAMTSSGCTTDPTHLPAWGATQELGDYLAAEALTALPQDLQTFLIETSIVDDLTPDLCDGLTARPGSLATLRRLTRLQVFTELVDPASNTFRYHRLFREFLRRRAEELPADRLQQIHAAAATWYTGAEQPTAAIHHSLASGRDDAALELLRTYYPSYAQAGRLATVNDWIEMYGLDRCRADGQLRLIAAWAALNLRRYDEVDAWLDVDDHAARELTYRCQAHVIRSHRARHLNQLDTARTEASVAVALADSPTLAGLDTSFIFAAALMAHQLHGTIDQDHASLAIRVGREVSNDSSAMTGYSMFGLLAVQDGRLEEADGFADQALAYVTTPRLERFHQPVTALLVKTKVALAQGRIGDAGAFADRAQSIAEASVEPALLALVLCEQTSISHARGQQDAAREHLRAAERAAGDDPTEYLAGEIRTAHNEIRFVASVADLPVELSEREIAVLRLLPHGLTRKELGEQLFVSENTIKTHMTSLRHKLGVSGRGADIVAKAQDLGLLP